MYTVGSLADLISGKETSNKQGVKIKAVKYEKTAKKEKPFTPEINVKLEHNSNKKRKRKLTENTNEIVEKKVRFTNDSQVPPKPEKTNAIDILKNKKLRNAEKRKLLKHTNKDSKKKLKKKPNLEEKIEENKDDRTIFVGNVPLTTKEKEIKKFFSIYGDIESVRFRGIPPPDMKTPKKVALIKKNFHPKRTTMIAYIVFKSNESATKAQIANGKNFNDFHLRVDSLDRLEYDKKKSIFLGNLPLDVEEEDVRKLFEDCGRISNIRLIRDSRTNVGKGFGFVNFEDVDAVELALQLENLKIGKREVRVSRGVNPEEKNKKKTADGKKIRERYAIHINNLPKNTTETDIRQLFSKCGKILSVRLSKGQFCYVNFENSKAVQKATNLMDAVINGTQIKINECKPKVQSDTKKMEKKSLAIYIKNIPLNTTREQLSELFKDCGNVPFVHIFKKRNRASGVGFVNFENEEAVEKALQKKVTIGKSELSISRKVSKSEAKAMNKPKEVEPASEEDSEEEIIKDLSGQKNWEDSSETESNENSEEEDDT